MSLVNCVINRALTRRDLASAVNPKGLSWAWHVWELRQWKFNEQPPIPSIFEYQWLERPTNPNGDLFSFRYRLSISHYCCLNVKDMKKEGLKDTPNFASMNSVRNHSTRFLRRLIAHQSCNAKNVTAERIRNKPSAVCCLLTFRHPLVLRDECEDGLQALQNTYDVFYDNWYIDNDTGLSNFGGWGSKPQSKSRSTIRFRLSTKQLQLIMDKRCTGDKAVAPSPFHNRNGSKLESDSLLEWGRCELTTERKRLAWISKPINLSTSFYSCCYIIRLHSSISLRL